MEGDERWGDDCFNNGIRKQLRLTWTWTHRDKQKHTETCAYTYKNTHTHSHTHTLYQSDSINYLWGQQVGCVKFSNLTYLCCFSSLVLLLPLGCHICEQHSAEWLAGRDDRQLSLSNWTCIEMTPDFYRCMVSYHIRHTWQWFLLKFKFFLRNIIPLILSVTLVWDAKSRYFL